MRKLHKYLYTLAFLSASLPSFADESENPVLVEKKDNPSQDDLQQRLDALCFDTVWGDTGARLAPAVLNPAGLGLVISGDYIYWTSYENGLIQPVISAIRHSQRLPENFATAIFSDYSFQQNTIGFSSVQFDFDSGYRVGIGYRANGYDNWELFAEYTQFQNKAHLSASYCCPEAPFCLPAQLEDDYDIQVTSKNSSPVELESNWRIDFYNLDVSLGESLFVSRHLLVRPYFGCKASWVEQYACLFTQTVIDDNSFLSSGHGIAKPTQYITIDSTLSIQDGKNKFWGVGPFFGLGTKWFLGKYLNLGAEASGAILFGKITVAEFIPNSSLTTVERFEPSPFGDISSNCNNTCFSYKVFTVVPTARILVDLGFDYPISQKFGFSARVGYELNYYWRQNYLETGTLLLQNSQFSTLPNSPGDLALQGLVAGIALYF